MYVNFVHFSIAKNKQTNTKLPVSEDCPECNNLKYQNLKKHPKIPICTLSVFV